MRQHRELQENESYVLNKRDVEAEAAATAVTDIAAVAETDATEVAAAEIDDAATSETPDVGADEPVLGMEKPVAPPTTTTTLKPLLAQERRLAALMEQLKSKLVIADNEQLTQMRARKEEVKAKMLADLEASRQLLSQKTAEAKQQLVNAQQQLVNAKQQQQQRNAQFREQVASQLTLFTLSPPIIGSDLVVEPTTQASTGEAGEEEASTNEGDEPVVGAAGPLPALGAGLLTPALNQLRNILQASGVAAPPAGAGAAALQRLLPGAALPAAVQTISGPELALLQQVKAKAYLSGLSAKAAAQKNLLRKKLLAKPLGLAAWARSVRWHNWNINWFYIE